MLLHIMTACQRDSLLYLTFTQTWSLETGHTKAFAGWFIYLFMKKARLFLTDQKKKKMGNSGEMENSVICFTDIPDKPGTTAHLNNHSTDPSNWAETCLSNLCFKTQLLGQRKVCSQFVPANSPEMRRLERELSKAGCDRVEFYLCCYPEAYGFRPQEKSASFLAATLMHAWRGQTLLSNASPELASAIKAFCLPCIPPTGRLKKLPKDVPVLLR